jgi:hypothetical protein
MRTNRSWFLVSVIAMLSLGILALPARGAQGRGGGKSNHNGHGAADAKKAKPARPDHAATSDAQHARAEPQRANGHVIVIDQAGHRRIVQEFYSGGSLPPGLAKRDSLPPGLSKQLRERGQLPPGLQKRLTPVPAALGSRLPAMPAHYTRSFAGRDLIFVDTRTNRIVSIIRDIRP